MSATHLKQRHGVGLGLIVAHVIHAQRKMNNRIQRHGNQSALISVMCHPDVDTELNLQGSETTRHDSTKLDKHGISPKPLMWSVTQQRPGGYGYKSRNRTFKDKSA